MTNVSCLVLQYAFLDPRFLNPFAIFHAFDTLNLAPFPLFDVGFSVFKQVLGTDALRNGLHENTWVNALMAEYKSGPFCPDAPAEDDTKLPDWIITDTRFPNEAQAIKNAGGIVNRVDRSGIKDIYAHPSETGLTIGTLTTRSGTVLI